MTSLFAFAANCIPLLIQQNVDGLYFFNRSWAEFKVGFNDTRGNYWLGNDLLHQLTYRSQYKLRVDLQTRNLSWYYAEYSTFAVSNEASNYRLAVSMYSGNAGDALSGHNGMMFTSYDRDNDQWTGNNCVVLTGGGFWYNKCGAAFVNGAGGGFSWNAIHLQSTRIWLTC